MSQLCPKCQKGLVTIHHSEDRDIVEIVMECTECEFYAKFYTNLLDLKNWEDIAEAIRVQLWEANFLFKKRELKNA
jgi:hypothetical protein